MENYVKFDDSYFRKTIREYQDWKMAFFRETGQNSVDAKGTEIKYTIQEDKDGIVVTCDDNGYGMDENVLLNKFLVMGGSYKEGTDSVGGFGYAKSIILFCHKEYEIHTRDNLIKGSYGRFSDVQKVEYRKGTKIIVKIDRDEARLYELKYKLENWVKNSNLKNVNFFLNDVLLEQNNNKFKYQKDITIGKIKFNDNPNDYSSSIWIRMRGMPMFEREIWTNSSSKFKGFIDLDFKSSLDCLTSNRDGLLKEYDTALNQLIQELTTERSRFTSDKMAEFIMNENKWTDENEENKESYITHSFSSDEELLQQFEEYIEDNEQEITLIEDNPREDSYVKRTILTADNNDVDIFKKLKDDASLLSDKIQKVLSKITSSKYPASFLVKIDNIDSEYSREVIKEYNKVIKSINQKRNIKMAHHWTKTVYNILNVLKDDERFGIYKENGVFYYFNKRIHTGFIYSELSDEYGMHTSKEDFRSILLNLPKFRKEHLNEGDLRYIVVHEIAHIFESNHNSNHSAYMFAIDKAIRDAKIKI